MEKDQSLRYDLGYTQKVYSEKFDRYFENTTLDTFWGDEKFVRCVDKYGDEGWIVGYHETIHTNRCDTQPWHWVIRDRDNAMVGIKECNLVSVKHKK